MRRNRTSGQPVRLTQESRRYWLGHCQGFRVEGPSGYIGTVEEVRFGANRDSPEELRLCCGRLRLHTRLLDVDEVVAVVPRETRLRVAGAPVRQGRGLLGRRPLTTAR